MFADHLLTNYIVECSISLLIGTVLILTVYYRKLNCTKYVVGLMFLRLVITQVFLNHLSEVLEVVETELYLF